MEFVDSKLISYDKKMKKMNKERLDKLSNLTTTIYKKIVKMNTIDNRRIILDTALSLHEDFKQIKDHALALNNVKRDLKIISEEEYEENDKHILNTNEQQIYWEIFHENRMIYEPLIESVNIMPWKGTWDYSDCKGMFDMDIIELAKHIKKDLQSMYPDIKFSVTSNKGYFKYDDSINIRFLKIPKKYLEFRKFSDWAYVKDDVMNEIFEYRKEFAPRLHMFVDYLNIEQDQVIEDEI